MAAQCVCGGPFVKHVLSTTDLCHWIKDGRRRWRYSQTSIFLQRFYLSIPWFKSFSITPSVKLQPKCLCGCRFKSIICQERWRLNNHKTNKGNGLRSLCTFFYSEQRERFCYIWRPSTSDHIICTIQYSRKYISRGSEASQRKRSAHKHHQQRHRDSWWFSNRVYSSFLSLVKRWQIHLISAVWCYMNFTGETLSPPAQMSLKPEASHSLFCLIEALRGKLNNSPM